MEGALAITNSLARDESFNVVESQRLSNALLSLFGWCFPLADRPIRGRFDECFSLILDYMQEDTDVSAVEPRIRAEIADLARILGIHPTPSSQSGTYSAVDISDGNFRRLWACSNPA